MDLKIERNALVVLYDGEEIKRLPLSLKKHLKTVRPFISKQDCLEYLNCFELKQCEKRALFLLSRRNYFSEKLIKSLIDKGFSKKAATRAVQKCEHFQYLDDQASEKRFIQLEMKKGNGPLLIYQKLRNKKSDVSLEKILEIYTQDKQLEVIRRVMTRTKHAGPKLYAYLMRKGFSSTVISSVIND